MRRSLAAMVLLGIATAGAPVRAGDDDVSIRPYDGLVWGGVPPEHVLFLVRDAATRRPIPGAIVRRHIEMEMGDDAVWAPPRGEWRTDAHGLFTLDCATTEDGDAVSHWAIEAPGYAVTETYGGAGSWEEIDLEPPRDLHGVLLAPLGGPARGVLVEWKVGCAHAPALRVGRTDADGRFVLRGVGSEGDVCYDGPGILADYAPPTAIGPAALPPPVTVAAPALTLRGRIVNAPPGVLEQAVMRGMTSSRGPLARVARDGTFVLEGVGEGDEVWLDALGKERFAALDTGDYRPGGPLTWDLGPPAPDAPTVRVAVREQWAAGKPDDLEVPVAIAFDAVDGGRRTELLLAEDADVLDATVDLAPGSYDVSVAGDDRLAAVFRRFRTPPQRLEVRPAPAATPAITIALVAQPRLEVAFSTPPDDEELLLHVDVPGAGHVFRRGDAAFLPADVDAVVRVAGHLRTTRVGPVEGGAAGGARRVVVDPRPTATLRLAGLGADDTLEIQGQYGLEATRRDGAATFAWTGRPGPLRLRVFFEAGGSAETTLTVPDTPGTVLDVDVAALPRRARGRIDLDGPGAGAAPVTLYAFDDDGNEVRAEVPAGTTHAEHPAFTAGRAVRVVRDEGVDAVVTLAGTSPFRLTLPSATLRLRFRAVDDVPPWPSVSVEGVGTDFSPEPERWERDDDGKDVPRGDAIVTIRGLPAGVTTAWVAPLPGARAIEVRVPLRDGETREVVVPSFPR